MLTHSNAKVSVFVQKISFDVVQMDSYNPCTAQFRHATRTGITISFMIMKNFCSLKSTFGNDIKGHHFADLASFCLKYLPGTTYEISFTHVNTPQRWKQTRSKWVVA